MADDARLRLELGPAACKEKLSSSANSLCQRKKQNISQAAWLLFKYSPTEKLSHQNILLVGNGSRI